MKKRGKGKKIQDDTGKITWGPPKRNKKRKRKIGNKEWMQKGIKKGIRKEGKISKWMNERQW